MPSADINGILIDYAVCGKGEALILIPGLGANQSIWEPQVAFFKKYFRVITFDNRGTGKSGKPAGAYDTKIMAGDTIGLMDHLGIEMANILGVSMGGMIVQEIAINYPQRVKRAILASTYARLDNVSSGPTQAMVEAAKLPSAKLGFALIGLAYNRPLYRLLAVLRVMVRSRFKKTPDKNRGKNGFTGQIQACLKHDTLNRLSLIKAPTLVIAESHDKVIKPSSSEVIARGIPGARLVFVKNGSHSFHAEMKKAFNTEVLNFLKNS